MWNAINLIFLIFWLGQHGNINNARQAYRQRRRKRVSLSEIYGTKVTSQAFILIKSWITPTVRTRQPVRVWRNIASLARWEAAKLISRLWPHPQLSLINKRHNRRCFGGAINQRCDEASVKRASLWVSEQLELITVFAQSKLRRSFYSQSVDAKQTRETRAETRSLSNDLKLVQIVWFESVNFHVLFTIKSSLAIISWDVLLWDWSSRLVGAEQYCGSSHCLKPKRRWLGWRRRKKRCFTMVISTIERA